MAEGGETGPKNTRKTPLVWGRRGISWAPVGY